ncbi:unnamed protein product [Arabidopsis thaliana]|uniref:(thale cress) hypothetical protein n=1 Tax=Arabidopsis thaliana TaxID=3702 RepID=A0A7G2EM28_ARATH|nr:unnamed protein product [Arabidopsis thaliana]
MKIDNAREEKKKKGQKRKHQNDQADMEMLKLRAALEGKHRSNGSTVLKSAKAQKRQKSEDSEDEFYRQVKQKQEAKKSAKAEIYSRKPYLIPSSPDLVDGRRLISNQMASNRGLTRKRNKDHKNPRKKYRDQHKKKVINRKGQVRDIRTQVGPYAGETRGINPYTSRSIRIKN